MKNSVDILTKKNRYLNEQKAIAEGILHYSTPEQIEIIENCLDGAFLEGMKVGLEESRKIYKEIHKDYEK